MLHKIKSKRGFTLVELCVVIAITAIVVSMTVLFTTLMSKRVSQSNIHNEVITSISDMETGIKNWITHYDNTDYRIEIGSGQSSLEAWDTKGTENTGDDTCAAKLYISDDGKKLICQGASDFSIKHIRSVKFAKSGNKNIIITCDIKYYDPSIKQEHKDSDTRIIFSTHSGMKINY